LYVSSFRRVQWQLEIVATPAGELGGAFLRRVNVSS
jgi:hypothetical protein